MANEPDLTVDRRASKVERRARGAWRFYALIPITSIVLLAVIVRLYRLPELPPGLNFDEAGNGVAALDILQGRPRLWWSIGGGKEPLWPYMVALSTLVLTPTPLALRLPAALIGILSVASLYPLVRGLFRGREGYIVALFAMLGLTFSAWHLHFSRLGFRAIFLPLLASLAFYFFWRALAISRRRLLILAAFLLALAIYAYLAARLLPVVLLLFLALHGFQARSGQHPVSIRRLAGQGGLLFGWLLLLLLPLGLYFVINPADFLARSATVSIFNPDWHRGDLPGTLWQTLRLTLGTFLGGAGDANPLVNLPGQPILSPLLAVFFVLGLLVAVFNLRRPDPTCRSGRPCPYLFLLCWWSVMLLPAMLAPEGAPHHLRLIGTLMPTYIIVAIGLATTTGWLATLLGRGTRLSSGQAWALASLLPLGCYGLLAAQTGLNYFGRWPVSVDFTLPFDLYATRLAAEIKRERADTSFVLPMDIRAGDEARHYTLDYLLGRSATGSAGPATSGYIYIPVDERNAEILLNQAAADKAELRVVRWLEDKHHEADAKEIVTFLLETGAQPIDRTIFPVYVLESYALENHALSPPAPAGCSAGSGAGQVQANCWPASGKFSLPPIDQPLGLTFDGLLRLDAAFVPATVSPGEWLPVALRLAPVGPMEMDYKASLRLVSPIGERLAQKDRLLMHNFHQGTSLWPPESVNEYYLLPVPVESPPGDYQVTLVLYQPETLVPLVAEGQLEVLLGKVRVDASGD